MSDFAMAAMPPPARRSLLKQVAVAAATLVAGAFVAKTTGPHVLALASYPFPAIGRGLQLLHPLATQLFDPRNILNTFRAIPQAVAMGPARDVLTNPLGTVAGAVTQPGRHVADLAALAALGGAAAVAIESARQGRVPVAPAVNPAARAVDTAAAGLEA